MAAHLTRSLSSMAEHSPDWENRCRVQIRQRVQTGRRRLVWRMTECEALPDWPALRYVCGLSGPALSGASGWSAQRGTHRLWLGRGGKTQSTFSTQWRLAQWQSTRLLIARLEVRILRGQLMRQLDLPAASRRVQACRVGIAPHPCACVAQRRRPSRTAGA